MYYVTLTDLMHLMAIYFQQSSDIIHWTFSVILMVTLFLVSKCYGNLRPNISPSVELHPGSYLLV